MKKFLVALLLGTTIAGSAFAQSVTFTPEQIKKIEDHIIGLNTQIEELTAKNKQQAEIIKALKAEVAEANQKINAPSDNANGVVNNLLGKDHNEVTQLVKMSKSGICHTPSSSYYSRTKNYTSFNSLAECLNAGGREPK